jgi:2-methylcitrate dehydratase PrpD
VHQSKFSMGTVLAMVALHGRAGMAEFDAHYRDPAAIAFRDRVHMELDADVDAAYPARWIGKVEVTTRDGRRLAARVDEPKGDPGNTLSRAELEDKAVRLAQYGGAASESEVRTLAQRVWRITDAPTMTRLLA